MHQPGYVQGGQEVGRDYLLLRIHVRRIPSDIIVIFLCLSSLCATGRGYTYIS
jgi:hypothetical protein